MAGCSSCGQRANANAIVAYKVVGKNGADLGEFVTRVDAERKRLENPGASIRPVTRAEQNKAPGPATNSQSKAAGA